MSENLISFEDAANDLLSGAAYIAERLKSADGKADAMQRIVPQFLADGNVDLAAALADSVEDPLTRDRLLVAVASQCAAADDDEYAFQLAEAVEDLSLRAQALEEIALAKASKDGGAKAVEIAEGLAHPDPVLIAVAGERYSNGDIEGAKRLAENFELPISKAVVYQHFAAVAFKDDDKQRAAEVLEVAAEAAAGIDFDEERLRTRLDIANNFVDVGRNDRAISIFDAAKADAEGIASVHREAFLAAVAVGFFRAGSVDLADRTLDLVSDKTAIVTGLSGFASVLRRKGETAEAVEAVDEALEILGSQKEKETRDHSVKFNQWMGLAVELALCGEDARALSTAEEIPDGDVRMRCLTRLAGVFAGDGRDGSARAAVEAIPENLQKGTALVSMADAKSASGDSAEALKCLENAVQTLSEIETPLARTSLMAECVRRFFANGDEARGRAIGADCCREIGTIIDESIRAAQLASLAASYRENGVELSGTEREILASVVGKS